MISREQARDIAEQFLRERGPMPGWDGIDRVLTPEEVEAALPPPLRSAPGESARWRHCWLAYVRGTAGGVIYLARDTGQVEFAAAVQGEPRPRSG